MDAQDQDAHNNGARDEIARVAAHDVRHMLSRSGLHEIVELARSVAENGAGTRQAPGAPHGGPRYPMRGE